MRDSETDSDNTTYSSTSKENFLTKVNNYNDKTLEHWWNTYPDKFEFEIHFKVNKIKYFVTYSTNSSTVVRQIILIKDQYL